MRGYKFYVRKFLNRPGNHTTAFILASVDAGGYCELIISDCQKQVSLSITKGSKNDLAKLDILLDTLKQFRRAVQ